MSLYLKKQDNILLIVPEKVFLGFIIISNFSFVVNIYIINILYFKFIFHN